MYNIVKNEGVTKLYFGVSPAIYRHLIYTTFRMTAYQYLRPKIGNNATLGKDFWLFLIDFYLSF